MTESFKRFMANSRDVASLAERCETAERENDRLRTELSKVSDNAADRAIECGELYQERDEARQERDAWEAETKRRVAPSTYSVIRGAVRRRVGLDVPAADATTKEATDA